MSICRVPVPPPIMETTPAAHAKHTCVTRMNEVSLRWVAFETWTYSTQLSALLTEQAVAGPPAAHASAAEQAPTGAPVARAAAASTTALSAQAAAGTPAAHAPEAQAGTPGRPSAHAARSLSTSSSSTGSDGSSVELLSVKSSSVEPSSSTTSDGGSVEPSSVKPSRGSDGGSAQAACSGTCGHGLPSSAACLLCRHAAAPELLLLFEGLDTVANVYVGGTLLLKVCCI